jgi:hypothetical protein
MLNHIPLRLLEDINMNNHARFVGGDPRVAPFADTHGDCAISCR